MFTSLLYLSDLPFGSIYGPICLLLLHWPIVLRFWLQLYKVPRSLYPISSSTQSYTCLYILFCWVQINKSVVHYWRVNAVVNVSFHLYLHKWVGNMLSSVGSYMEICLISLVFPLFTFLWKIQKHLITMPYLYVVRQTGYVNSPFIVNC